MHERACVAFNFAIAASKSRLVHKQANGRCVDSEANIPEPTQVAFRSRFVEWIRIKFNSRSVTF